MIRHTLQPLIGVFACLLLVIALVAFSPSTPTSPPTVSAPGPTLGEILPPPAPPLPDEKTIWGLPSEAQKVESRRRNELMTGCIKAKAKHPLAQCVRWNQVPASSLTDAVVGTMPPSD